MGNHQGDLKNYVYIYDDMLLERKRHCSKASKGHPSDNILIRVRPLNISSKTYF